MWDAVTGSAACRQYTERASSALATCGVIVHGSRGAKRPQEKLLGQQRTMPLRNCSLDIHFCVRRGGLTAQPHAEMSFSFVVKEAMRPQESLYEELADLGSVASIRSFAPQMLKC